MIREAAERLRMHIFRRLTWRVSMQASACRGLATIVPIQYEFTESLWLNLLQNRIKCADFELNLQLHELHQGGLFFNI